METSVVLSIVVIVMLLYGVYQYNRHSKQRAKQVIWTTSKYNQRAKDNTLFLSFIESHRSQLCDFQKTEVRGSLAMIGTLNGFLTVIKFQDEHFILGYPVSLSFNDSDFRLPVDLTRLPNSKDEIYPGSLGAGVTLLSKITVSPNS